MRLHQKDHARAALAEADRLSTEGLNPANEEYVPVWVLWAVAKHLRAEAAGLIDGDSPAPKP